MFNLKRLLIICLLFSLALPTVVSAKTDNEDKLDKILLKAGFPQTVVDSYPISIKEDWVSRGVTEYQGQVSTYYKKNAETGELEEVAIVDDSNGSGISIMATIPTSDMVFRTTRAASGPTSWGIQNEIEWLSPDYWMYPEDTLSTNWSSNLRAYGNTFSCREFYKDVNGNWQDDPGLCGGQPYSITTGGVAWKIDFYNGFSGYKAYSMQTVYVSDGSAHGTASIFQTYAHDTSSSYTIGVTLGFASATYSSSGSFDQAAKQYDFTY